MSQEQKTILLPLAEYQELQYWMDRSEDKGHLDGTDVQEPWRKLQAAMAALSPTPSDAGKDDARDVFFGSKIKRHEESSIHLALHELYGISIAYGDHRQEEAHKLKKSVLQTLLAKYRDVLFCDLTGTLEDAKRYRWLVAQVPCNVADAVQSHGIHKDELDSAIDAALSSLKVIGKGEKG